MTKAVLSIDGGGVRGIIPAYFLLRVQRSVNDKLNASANNRLRNLVGRWRFKDVFDIIIGTSTGSIVAAGLCLPENYQTVLNTTRGQVTLRGPVSPSRLIKIYYDNADYIFTQPWAKNIVHTVSNLYSADHLEEVLKTYLGGKNSAAVTLRDIHDGPAARAHFMACAYDMTHHMPRVFFSWLQTEVGQKAEVDPEDYETCRSFKATNFALWQACRASSAAPTYFPAADIDVKQDDHHHAARFVDGGVFANNPTSIGVGGLTSLFEHKELDSPFVLSVGTGAYKQDLNVSSNAGIIGWGANMINICFDGQSEVVHRTSRLQWGRMMNYYRLQCEFQREVTMDDGSKENMRFLLNQARQEADSDAKIEELRASRAIDATSEEIVQQLTQRLESQDYENVALARDLDWPVPDEDKHEQGNGVVDWDDV